MPFPATIHVPEFMRLEQGELNCLLQVLRDPLAVHLYMLLLTQMRFTDGEFMSSYARLIELMTPPQPERGRRRTAPTLRQVRRALDDLISVNLVLRGRSNEAQGELRLHLASRMKTQQKPANSQARPN